MKRGIFTVRKKVEDYKTHRNKIDVGGKRFTPLPADAARVLESGTKMKFRFGPGG